MSVYQVLLSAHGASGVVALITFWIAGLSKKGSPLHRGAGKVYLAAMLGIIATAVPMAAIIAGTGRYATATFLVYLVVITATSMWSGWRAIRRKRDQAGFRDGRYLAVALLNLSASAVVLAVGLRTSQMLLTGFSLVGFSIAAQILIRHARPLAESRWWLREHIGAMVGCGIATHIAFLAIGLNRLLEGAGVVASGGYQMISWFAPVLVGIAANIWLARKYVSRARNTIAAPVAEAQHGAY